VGRKRNNQEKFARLKQLRCFDRVMDMLSYGYPATEVAKFIRSQGEYKGAKLVSIAEALRKYRREEMLPSDVLACRRPDIIVKAKKQYSDKLQELRELDLLREHYWNRFALALARETDSGIPSQTVDRTGKALLDIVRTMHNVKMDLGISGKRQLGTLHLSPERLEEISKKYGEGPARAMADPVSRARVLAYLRKVQDAAMLRARQEEESGIEVKKSSDSNTEKRQKKN
jgi:hypothetical protein